MRSSTRPWAPRPHVRHLENHGPPTNTRLDHAPPGPLIGRGFRNLENYSLRLPSTATTSRGTIHPPCGYRGALPTRWRRPANANVATSRVAYSTTVLMSIFIVLGAHRSGTSAVAGLLHQSGIVMGSTRTFRPRPTVENPLGFFENIEFRRLNDALLRRSGHRVKEWNPSPVLVRASRRFMPWMERLLREYTSLYGLWGWKDPRQMLTLRAWHHALHSLNLLPETNIILVYRDPGAVADSLQRRGNVNSLSHGIAVWQLYNETALDALSLFEEQAVFALRYEDFVSDPHSYARSMSQWSQTSIVEDRVHQFVSTNLQRSTRYEVSGWPDVNIQETYTRLQSIARRSIT